MRTNRKKGAGVLNELFDLSPLYPQCSSDGRKIHTDKFGGRSGSQGKSQLYQVHVESYLQIDRYDGEGWENSLTSFSRAVISMCNLFYFSGVGRRFNVIRDDGKWLWSNLCARTDRSGWCNIDVCRCSGVLGHVCCWWVRDGLVTLSSGISALINEILLKSKFRRICSKCVTSSSIKLTRLLSI